jgi:hypothetical protein
MPQLAGNPDDASETLVATQSKACVPARESRPANRIRDVARGARPGSRRLRLRSDCGGIANDSEYALGGTVWSADTDRANEVARKVTTGTADEQLLGPHPLGGSRGLSGAHRGRVVAVYK